MLHEVHPLDSKDVRLLEGKAMHETLKNSSEKLSGDTVALNDCLIFDIETTGLSADTSFIFLIGCIGCEDGVWYLHQFFIRMVQEEKELLSSFFELAGNYRTLVHFNGNTFDLPFIRKRAAVYRLESVTDTLMSIDLYRYFSPLRKRLKLPHMNQSFLEAYVGWHRDDQMSGKEVVSLFWNYSVSKGKEEERLLLLHNHDDLLGMLRVPAMEAYFSLLSGKIGPVVTAAESKGLNSLLLTFETELPLPSCMELVAPAAKCSVTEKTLKSNENSNYSTQVITLRAENTSGQLWVPFYNGKLRYFFPDYKNYYYLPLEKQAIHKSVAAYVEKEYREPARPETCFIEKSGRFLPLLSSTPQDDIESGVLTRPPFSPVLKESYNSKTYYFEYKGIHTFEEQSMDSILTYTRLQLKSF